jgi:hypothetical protein
MCLELKPSFETIELALAHPPRIAQNDITVFKVLIPIESGDVCMSPIRMFRYKLGLLYKVDLRPKPMEINSVYLVFAGGDTINRPYKLEINEGLHSFANLRAAINFKNNIENAQGCYGSIFKCTIPVGSQYFINSAEVASNQLIINGRLD